VLLKAHEYGITFDKLGINYPQFHRRKESVVKRLFQGTQFLLKKNGVEVFEGEGQLTSAQNVLVKKNGTDIVELTAKNVILATGSVPLIPIYPMMEIRTTSMASYYRKKFLTHHYSWCRCCRNRVRIFNILGSKLPS
jgi:pyruvate/2-oxoglutarate dehydrogenase complex dihydrolipoamide dehydrogenase (E3) component